MSQEMLIHVAYLHLITNKSQWRDLRIIRPYVSVPLSRWCSQHCGTLGILVSSRSIPNLPWQHNELSVYKGYFSQQTHHGLFWKRCVWNLVRDLNLTIPLFVSCCVPWVLYRVVSHGETNVLMQYWNKQTRIYCLWKLLVIGGPFYLERLTRIWTWINDNIHIFINHCWSYSMGEYIQVTDHISRCMYCRCM